MSAKITVVIISLTIFKCQWLIFHVIKSKIMDFSKKIIITICPRKFFVIICVHIIVKFFIFTCYEIN